MSRALYCVVILCVGAGVYANSLGNGFTFDDQPLIVQNPLVQQPDFWAVFSSPYWVGHPEYGLYRPLTTLSYVINQAVFGRGPFGFHLVNLCLHIGNVLLLFALARIWLERLPAGICALVFLVHPIQTEAVNSAVGRSELLGAFWVLIGWLAYARLTGWMRYVAASVALLLGCLSKEHAAALLGILVVYDVLTRLNESHGMARWVRQDVPRYVPFAGVIAVFLWLRYAVIGSLLIPKTPNFIDNPLAHLSAVDRMLTAIGVMGKYLGLLVWPQTLSADYSFHAIPLATDGLSAWFWLGVLALMAVVAMIAICMRNRPVPIWGFGLAAMFIPFIPVSNLLFPIGTSMAERLAYMPMIGISLMAGWGLGRLRDRSRRYAFAGIVILIAMSGRTAIRNGDWHSDETLFRSAVLSVPNSAKAHFNLGNAVRDRGDWQNALRHYGRAIALYPGYAEVHYNMGVIHQEQGHDLEALRAYQTAIEADSLHADAWTNLGVMGAQAGDHGSALNAFARVLRIHPERLDARMNYAQACRDAGQIDAAVDAYQAVLGRDPGYEEAGLKLSDLYRQVGDLNAAISTLRGVVAANGRAVHAMVNLGVLLDRQGQFAEAAKVLRRVGEMGGERSGLALLAAGRLYVRLGRFENARQALNRFLKRWQGDPALRQRAEKMLQRLPID